jgi:hypothetical protein
VVESVQAHLKIAIEYRDSDTGKTFTRQWPPRVGTESHMKHFFLEASSRPGDSRHSLTHVAFVMRCPQTSYGKVRPVALTPTKRRP